MELRTRVSFEMLASPEQESVAPAPVPFAQPSPGLALLPQGHCTEPEPSPEQNTVQGPPGAPAMTVSKVPEPIPAVLNAPNWIR